MPELVLNLSRGCGNPTGFAGLQAGETVVDLGCGGGIDVILAARRVGSHGHVVGVDFAEQMIGRARQAVADAELPDQNIEFRPAEMETSGLPDGFADVVISNCVINLCPDKSAVYEEAFRGLTWGGRLAISDIALTESIDPGLKDRFQSTWAGCLGGSISEEQYWQTVSAAGFSEIQVVARHILTSGELEAMACCPGEEYVPHPGKEHLARVEGKVASVKFTAMKLPQA